MQNAELICILHSGTPLAASRRPFPTKTLTVRPGATTFCPVTTAPALDAPATLAPTATPQTAARIASVDIIRGVVMVLMAIDHVRVFAGVPAGGASVAIFFTRWVTHFCAPAFIFLAGTSAFLYGRKHENLSRFLLTRGLRLVVLELTVIRVSWTFNFEFRQYMLAGVIWVIGWCMILMAGLVKLPIRVVAAIGLAIIFGHNLLDGWLFTAAEGLGKDLRSNLRKLLYIGPIGPGVAMFFAV